MGATTTHRAEPRPDSVYTTLGYVRHTRGYNTGRSFIEHARCVTCGRQIEHTIRGWRHRAKEGL